MIRQPPKSPKEFISARQAADTSTVVALTATARNAPKAHRAEINCLALRISLCSSDKNQYIAKVPAPENPNRRYETTGRYWRCGSKLCSSCLARQSKRSRQILTQAVENCELRKGERYLFATFTIPNPNQTLLVTRSIVNYAWSLFRKRRLCVSLIRGGSKSEEFTLTVNGFHYHLHCLFICKWVLYDEIRRVWTECVEQSFAEHEQPFKVNTKDQMLWSKIIQVKPDRNIIREVCKYVTKSDSWPKLQNRGLAEIALIRRWHRMFELFGCLKTNATIQHEPAEPIVHTRSITDGSLMPSPKYWRDKVRLLGWTAYEMQLRHFVEIHIACERARMHRQFPDWAIYSYAGP